MSYFKILISHNGNKKFLLLLILSNIWFLTNAQKLPNIQSISLLASHNINIDGKDNDWNKFQAYNHATEIYYSMANDDNNLYLIIKATKPEIINKILLGGVTVAVNVTGKINDKGIAITYPTFYHNKRPNINLKNQTIPSKDTTLYKIKIDSFKRVINKELTDKAKLIEIEGVEEIPDTLISIYNISKIKVAALFDNEINYIYELSMPIKYLNLPLDATRLNYHIKLNGATANNAHIQLSNKGNFLIVTGSNGTYAVPASSQFLPYAYLTDFEGIYTLAKK